MRRYFAYGAIIAGLSLFVFILYRNSGASTQKRPFSTYTVLTSSWEKYKQEFINDDGRVVDPSQDFITTSEGQSYGLLRSVWIDDKDTFDKLWKWTKDNLQRDSDKLFGWRWGKLKGDNYGFTSPGGNNTASDADIDIALALILANRRWQQDVYLNDAKALLADIWKIETATASSKHYMTAGNWAQNEQELVLNPSYFAPYAFRIFAEVDNSPSRPWLDLVDTSYEILESSISTQSGLPPDWISLNRKTGTLMPPSARELSSNYSYDAMRIPFRIALDYQWNKEPRAKSFLENNFDVIKQDFQKTGQLKAGYLPNGTPLQDFENPTMYATSLGIFLITDKKLADKIYTDKIIRLYSSDSNSFDQDLPYYDQNWLWFGGALYNNYLSKF